MPTTRQSKRQAGESPGGDSLPKRARKPNTNTLEHFSLGQAPLRFDKRKKKKLLDEDNPIPTLQAKGRARKDVIEVSSAMGSDPPSAPSSPHTITGTPIPNRTKKAIKSPPPTFDPNIEGERPHYIQITFIPVLNGDEKKAGSCNININDILRPSFNDLWEVSYNAAIRRWEEDRKLKHHERAVKGDWTVFIGNPRGHHSKIQVCDDEDWRRLHSRLRSMAYYGDKKNLEWAHTIQVECEWYTVDRPKTPPVDSKAKKKESRTIQTVQLTNDQTPSDDDDDDEQVYNSDDLPTLRRTSSSKQPRDSITNRMLKEKRVRDEALPSERLIQKHIFGIWACKEERCDNRRGCCFVLKSTGQHYKVTTAEQAQWAAAIANNQSGATINQPPYDLIAKYEDGHGLQPLKRTGKKKIEPEPLKETPISLTINNPTPVQQPLQLPPQMPFQQPQYSNDWYDYRYQYRPPPIYGQQPPYMRQPRQKPAPEQRPHPPSSPIRSNATEEEQMDQFEEWVLGKEVAPTRQEAYRRVFELARKDCYLVSQLKERETISELKSKGAPAGIVALIPKQYSEFKAQYNAASALQALPGGHHHGDLGPSHRQEFGRNDEGERSGLTPEDGFFNDA